MLPVGNAVVATMPTIVDGITAPEPGSFYQHAIIYAYVFGVFVRHFESECGSRLCLLGYNGVSITETKWTKTEIDRIQ